MTTVNIINIIKKYVVKNNFNLFLNAIIMFNEDIIISKKNPFNSIREGRLLFHHFRKFLITFFLFLIFVTQSFGKQQHKQNLMIFAPSSLKDSLNEVIQSYQKREQFEIKQVYLGTAQLAQQIKNGAQPDIFISANIQWMEHLEKRGLVLEKYRYILLGNSLVAVTNYDHFNLRKKQYFNDVKKTFLETNTRISLAMVEAVPAGIYAKQFFKNIEIWQAIKFNIANSPNVRAAMSFVSRGDLEYGVVYRSDAMADKRVKIIYDLDPSYYTKIEYPMTILNKKEKTLNFYNFLKNKKNKNIFKRWGFIVRDD